MEPLAKFLARFEKFRPADEAYKQALSQAVKEATALDLDLSQIKIRGRLAWLNLAAAAKSEIYLHQESILKRTNEILKRPALTGLR